MIYNLPKTKKKVDPNTWLLNEYIIINNINPPLTEISFKSNNVTYTKISKLYAPDLIDTEAWMHVLKYDDSVVYQDGWIDKAYRTITFLESPTGDLLTWLQNNAVKQ